MRYLVYLMVAALLLAYVPNEVLVVFCISLVLFAIKAVWSGWESRKLEQERDMKSLVGLMVLILIIAYVPNAILIVIGVLLVLPFVYIAWSMRHSENEEGVIGNEAKAEYIPDAYCVQNQILQCIKPDSVEQMGEVWLITLSIGGVNSFELVLSYFYQGGNPYAESLDSKRFYSDDEDCWVICKQLPSEFGIDAQKLDSLLASKVEGEYCLYRSCYQRPQNYQLHPEREMTRFDAYELVRKNTGASQWLPWKILPAQLIAAKTLGVGQFAVEHQVWMGGLQLEGLVSGNRRDDIPIAYYWAWLHHGRSSIVAFHEIKQYWQKAFAGVGTQIITDEIVHFALQCGDVVFDLSYKPWQGLGGEAMSDGDLELSIEVMGDYSELKNSHRLDERVQNFVYCAIHKTDALGMVLDIEDYLNYPQLNRTPKKIQKVAAANNAALVWFDAQNDLIGFSLGEVTMVFESKSIDCIEVRNFCGGWIPDYATLAVIAVGGRETKIFTAGLFDFDAYEQPIEAILPVKYYIAEGQWK